MLVDPLVEERDVVAGEGLSLVRLGAGRVPHLDGLRTEGQGPFRQGPEGGNFPVQGPLNPCPAAVVGRGKVLAALRLALGQGRSG